MLRAKSVISHAMSPGADEFFDTPMLKVDPLDPWRMYKRVPRCCGWFADGPVPSLKAAKKSGVVALTPPLTSNASE